MTPGAAARPLPSGSEIRAGADVQLTDAVSGFDADARRALGNVLEKGGAGFAGEGATTGNAVSNAPALLSDATATLDAVRPNPGALAGLIGDARTVAGALATNALGGTVTAARRVLDATGAHSAALASAIDDLPALQANAAAVLPSTGRLLAALTSASETLRPGIAALASGIPDVVALEQRTPAVSVLGDVAGTVAPTLRALTPMLTKLAGPASGLTPLSTPVAELAGVLIPYRSELVQAPLGFTRWGNFTYDFGTGAGDRAVRFSMVLTCALARDPYPAPGAAGKERKPCP
jgi:hypothetical protein